MSNKNKSEETFIGLDIGSSQVVCVVGLVQPDSATASVIGLGVSPTRGLKRGMVTDVEETVSSITSALEEAERMSGTAIEHAMINIDGSHTASVNSRGIVAVARADHEISREDMARAEASASAISLDANREIIQTIPLAYHVDDQKNVEDPVGIHGLKLEIETHIVSASTPAIKNLQNAVFRSGVGIDGQIITPLAAASAVLSKKQKDAGVIVVHFGSETTGAVAFMDGKLCYSGIVALGSRNITKDLVYGLRTSEEVAEEIKLKYGVANKPKGKTNKKIDLSEYGAAGNVYQHDIDTIVSSRLDEIFTMIADDLSKANLTPEAISAGIILTGGGSNLEGIETFVSELFKMPATVAKLSEYSGITDSVNNPAYASAIGLMILDMNVPHGSGAGMGRIVSGGFGKIKSIIKSLLP